MEPYFERDGITLYLGDARDILPTLPRCDVIITDPVWPNAVPTLAGADDPAGLFAAVAAHFPALTNRVVVQLGCDSDPRFLAGMPPALPFFRACWLEYSVPSRKGRVLYGSDVAYVFGTPPPSEKGMHVMSGRCEAKGGAGKTPGHPCPRQLQHVQWLLRWYARGLVIDPFAGSGTTLLAAQKAGLPAIGIEISEAFCEATVKRLAQRSLVMGPA